MDRVSVILTLYFFISYFMLNLCKNLHMVKIHNVQLKHNGILADGSTKVTMYLPECTDEQHIEMIKLARERVIGVIFVTLEESEDISNVIGQALEVANEAPPIDTALNPSAKDYTEDDYDEGQF